MGDSMLKIIVIGTNRLLFAKLKFLAPNFMFTLAGSLGEASQEIRRNAPDLIFVMDFPPILNSLEFTPFLHSIGGRASYPFLFLAKTESPAVAPSLPSLYETLSCEDSLTRKKLIIQVMKLVRGRTILPLSVSAGSAVSESVPQFYSYPESPQSQQAASILVGKSHQIRMVREQIFRFAPHDEPVFILGESGTGKEVVANLIHDFSGRKGRLISQNCSALPLSLAESILFGYERGAFTGNTGSFRGIFEQADKGTLFLDEIGEMDPILQPKLLRIIERKSVNRIGSEKERKVTARIIAATNSNVDIHAKNISLRHDLVFRLNTLSITLPPLRERTEDIPMLAEFFLAKQQALDPDHHQFILTDKSLTRLSSYSWPGNVRELFSVLRKGILLSEKSNHTQQILNITPGLFPLRRRS